jgi:ATP synthase F1 delta subunit
MKKKSDFKTARLYARALYDSAESADNMSHIRHDVDVLKNLNFAALPETECFNSPIIELKTKISLLEAVCTKLGLKSQTQNFLKLLTENGNFKILNLVLDDFIALYNNSHNIAEVTVETVKKLEPRQDALLKEKLTGLFRKQVEINYVEKPEILGGLIIKNGTNLIDLSVAAKLKKIEQLMKGTD